MITPKFQILLAIFVIVGIVYIIRLIQRRRLDIKYSLSWLLIGIFVLILDCFPKTLGRLSDFLGIMYPVNMVFFIGFILSLIIILTLTISVSGLSSRCKKLIQEIALLEKRVSELEKENENET